MGRKRAGAAEHPMARLSDGATATIEPSQYAAGFELIVDGTPQSHVDLDDPRHVHFEYIARMVAAIDALCADDPLTAVHLGAGAMTLPRYLAATHAGSRQQVIELEPALVELVRSTLPLPAQREGGSIRVRIGDARDVATKLPAGLQGACDLVVSDVFSGAQTPRHLTSVELYRVLAGLLSAHGLLLVNVADGPGLAFARGQVATVAAAFAHVAVLADAQMFKGKRFGNLVIAASASPFPEAALARMTSAGPHPAKVMHGRELRDFVAGASVVTDATATASPHPDASVFDR